MKKFLILVSILLACGTTGLLAQTITAPTPAPSAPSQVSPAAKSGKHKHHHKRHHKKAKQK